MKVYKINKNGSRYCGPSALSALSGLGTKETAALLRKITGRKMITGVDTGDVLRAVNLLGFNFSGGTPAGEKKKTLNQWIKDVSSRNSKNVYLIVAGYHFMVVQGRQVICSMSNYDFMHVDDHPKRRAFVVEAYQITPSGQKVDVAKVIPPVQKKAPAVVNQTSLKYMIDLKNLKAVCEMFGLVLTLPDDIQKTYWVEPPVDLFADESEDPYDDDHFRDTPGEALVIALDYAKLIQEGRDK